MEISALPTLNDRLIQHDKTYGSDSLGVDFLHALIETIEGYKGDKRPDELRVQLLFLYDLLLACRPRMANITFDLQQTICYLQSEGCRSLEDLHSFLLGLVALRRTRKTQTIGHAKSLVGPSDSILIHSYSSLLLGLLSELKGKDERTGTRKGPKIFIATQDKEKTDKLLLKLAEIEMEHRVVSEFAISHMLPEITAGFFGALTINSEKQFIMGPGSASLVSQLNHQGLPVYVLLTTNKFSFWKEHTDPAFKEVREKKLEEISYKKITFSHDIVPAEQISAIVTEIGVFKPSELDDLYSKLQSEFFTSEERLRGVA